MTEPSYSNPLYDPKFWITVGLGGLLVAVFNFTSNAAALPVAIAFCLMAFFAIKQKPIRVLGLLLIAACYERPVLDFGIGIRGTIKLVDLIVLVFVIVNLLVGVKDSSAKPEEGLKGIRFNAWLLIAITFISVVSLLILGSIPFDAKLKSVYYFVLLVEYLLAYMYFQRLKASEHEIKVYLAYFLVGLLGVSIVAILQGVGVLENMYYTSVEDIATDIKDEWAISTLGPNHSHLGSYMAVGVMLTVVFFANTNSPLLLPCLGFFLLAIGFAHSAVGFGMVGLYIAFLFFRKGIKQKLIASVLGIVGFAFMNLYLSGIAGDYSERTTEKFSTDGDDIEIVERSFVRPFTLLAKAYKDDPFALLWGFGYRVPDYKSKYLPPTGDNNYFAVAMDIGFIGLAFYSLFLWRLVERQKSACTNRRAGFMSVYSDSAFVFLKVTLIAMLTQEILWPLHTRGSTMLIFLILFEVAAKATSIPVDNGRKSQWQAGSRLNVIR